MSGDLWQMARNGTTLLPSEVKKLAADYDRLRQDRDKWRAVFDELIEADDGMVDMALAHLYGAEEPFAKESRDLMHIALYEVAKFARWRVFGMELL